MNQPFCNICGSSDFSPFGKNHRVNALCTSCGSLERHRAIHSVLHSNKILKSLETNKEKRCLHLAPEYSTFSYLKPFFNSGYISSDIQPSLYPHTNALSLQLPSHFKIFPDNYFDLIIHNHVLEHIPGDYVNHLYQFSRILKTGCSMVFTVPDERILNQQPSTLQHGEYLPHERLRKMFFGQGDHYKWFGTDIIHILDKYFSSVSLLLDPQDDSTAKLKSTNNAFGLVFVCVK